MTPNFESQMRASLASLGHSEDSVSRMIDHCSSRSDCAEWRAEWAADFALVTSCLSGEAPRSVAAFVLRFGPLLRGAAGRVLRNGAAIDEFVQDLLSRAFVGDGAAPLLASYAPTGALAAWLQVVTIRAAVRASTRRVRDLRRDEEDLGDFCAAMVDDSPEVLALKDSYQAEFRAAFRRAAEALSADDRALLRGHLIEGRTTEALAGIHSVDRSTVSRWLSRIRTRLASEVRAELAKHKRLTGPECESVIRMLDSRLDFSLSVFDVR